MDPSTEETIVRRPAYLRIVDALRMAMHQGRIPAGCVLLEGPLAEIFGSSRAPVKQALALLESEGAVHRFDGRGVLVGRNVNPVRFEITADLFDGSPGALSCEPRSAVDLVYYQVEREILTRSMYGRFRVNELALARHHNIGRMTARDLLVKSQQSGIVVKGERSHWWTVPFDEKRIRDLYQLRQLLEPIALLDAAEHIPKAIVQQLANKLRMAIVAFPHPDFALLDGLERDLHTTCLSFCANRELTGALDRASVSFVSGKHMQAILAGPLARDSFLAEHLQIFDLLARGDAQAASSALRSHLKFSEQKAVERFREYHERFTAPAIPYILD